MAWLERIVAPFLASLAVLGCSLDLTLPDLGMPGDWSTHDRSTRDSLGEKGALTWSVRIVADGPCAEGEFVTGGGGVCADGDVLASYPDSTGGLPAKRWRLLCTSAAVYSVWSVCMKGPSAGLVYLNKTPNKAAVVSACPAGTLVGGGCLCDMTSLLTSRPLPLDARSWQCTCQGTPELNNYAYAICLPDGEAAKLGVHPGDADGACAPGETALGGGCTGGNGFSHSEPKASSWRCDYDGAVTAYVICGKLY